MSRFVLYHTETFNFMRSDLLIVGISSCSLGVLFRKIFYWAMSSRLLFILPSIRFKVSGQILRYLIHWSWFSCRIVCINLFLFFYMWPFHLTNNTHWRCCLLTQCVFLFSLQILNQMSIGMWIYICYTIWFIYQCVCFYYNIMLF